MAYGWRKRPVKRPTAASAKLREARHAARVTMKWLGGQIGVSWRTIARWESGETRPDVQEWLKLVGVLRPFAPQHAAHLAEAAGIMVPIVQPTAQAREATTDHDAIELAVLRAADHLDVAPGRVRSALRELLAALDAAHGTLADLSRAVQPPRASDQAGALMQQPVRQ